LERFINTPPCLFLPERRTRKRVRQWQRVLTKAARSFRFNLWLDLILYLLVNF
jgi:hypothetical protein